jgi:hypothetical protein
MNSLIEDMEMDIKTPNVSDSSLKSISDLCAEQVVVEDEVKQLEKQLKEKKDAVKKLSQEIIPARMQELGLESLKLKDGSAVEVKQLVQTSITAENRETALKWLRDNGHGDLIKNQVSAAFGRGEDITAEKFINEAKSLGLEPTQRVWVEPMTLKAFVREKIEEGVEIPTETFSIFVGAQTKIVKSEK